MDIKLKGSHAGSTCSRSQSNVDEVRAVERSPWATLQWALAFSIGGDTLTCTNAQVCIVEVNVQWLLLIFDFALVVF